MTKEAVGPLRALRHSHGLTLEELAERTGLSMAALSRIERGERKPKAETLARIAQALGLKELSELLRPWVPPEDGP